MINDSFELSKQLFSQSSFSIWTFPSKKSAKKLWKLTLLGKFRSFLYGDFICSSKKLIFLVGRIRNPNVWKSSLSIPECRFNPTPPHSNPEFNNVSTSRRESSQSPGEQSGNPEPNQSDQGCQNSLEKKKEEEAPKKPLHPRLLSAQAQLEMKPLWDEFHELGTEMIVTKAGR